MPKCLSRFYENTEFSDYRKPDFGRPLMICGIVILTALVVLCLTKGIPQKSSNKDGCGVCTSGRATRNHNQSTGEAVHAKNEDHLQELIATESVVMFHAPWCGHCATLLPIFKSAAQEHDDMLYVLCDCENAVGKDTIQQQQLEGFPTVRYYVNGKPVEEYHGPREKAALINWSASKKTTNRDK